MRKLKSLANGKKRRKILISNIDSYFAFCVRNRFILIFKYYTYKRMFSTYIYIYFLFFSSWGTRLQFSHSDNYEFYLMRTGMFSIYWEKFLRKIFKTPSQQYYYYFITYSYLGNMSAWAYVRCKKEKIKYTCSCENRS
jgi:hypothetical protein